MLEKAKREMLSAYIDWKVDNPTDKSLEKVFFLKQKEYLALKVRA